MKSARWLALLLLLVGAMLFLMRQKQERTATAAPDSAVVEAVVETVSTAGNKPESAPLAPADAPAQKADDPLEGANHLQVTVVDDSDRPIEGALIRTALLAERRRPVQTSLLRAFATSAHGMADVLWPTQKIERLEIIVAKDEYGARKMNWDLGAGDQVPANCRVKLWSAFRVGGTVVDPEGKPVADATVKLHRFWPASFPRAMQGEDAEFAAQTHTTGADGRWSAGHVSAELVERIFIIGSHTNFIATRVSMGGRSDIISALQAGTHRLHLTRGFSARGRVVNEQQQPVAGAEVTAGRKYSENRRKARTDAEGRFTVLNVDTGRVDFAASADGYAPGFKTQDVGAVTEEIVILLEKGSTIRGVVQDEAQQPIKGASVVLQGARSEPLTDRMEFSTETDAEGKFAWCSAPNQTLQFYVGLSGYQQKRDVMLEPNFDNVVTLRLNRKITGQVVDAETDQPVTRFTAASGRVYSDDQFSANSSETKEFKNERGEFTLEVHEENVNGVQVTAVGYAEQVQKLPAAENGEVKILIKLKPSPTLAGIVVTTGGRPVPGAGVALVDQQFASGRSIQFVRGQLVNASARNKVIRTDAAGRFEFSSPPDAGLVATANGTGYGSATIAEVRASGVITLQAFGRIDGILLQGSRPGAGQDVHLTAPNTALRFDWETMRKTTDAQGLFSFEDVPAGTFAIARLYKTSPNAWQQSHTTPVVVQAGQTTDIVLGGTDATLQGQVKFETPPSDSDYRLTVSLNQDQPLLPEGLSPEERRAYYSSDAWKELMKQQKRYTGTVNPDGSLNLDGVAPGQYALVIKAFKNGEEEYRSSPIATGGVTVTVPVGASPSTPIHIGEVVLKALK